MDFIPQKTNRYAVVSAMQTAIVQWL